LSVDIYVYKIVYHFVEIKLMSIAGSGLRRQLEEPTVSTFGLAVEFLRD